MARMTADQTMATLPAAPIGPAATRLAAPLTRLIARLRAAHHRRRTLRELEGLSLTQLRDLPDELLRDLGIDAEATARDQQLQNTRLLMIGLTGR